MIYISVPEGMKFVQKELGEDIQDVFEDNDGRLIRLQPIVKAFLQYRCDMVQVKAILKEELAGLVLYSKKPPNSTDVFLEYQQVNNGKLPTTHT